jgi:anthranilate phosphoribosyltransferase
LDGYDEVSLTGPTKITSSMEGVLNPADFGVNLLSQSEIQGGQTIEESAQMFTNIISGNGTEAQNNVVVPMWEWPSQRQRNVHRSKDSK